MSEGIWWCNTHQREATYYNLGSQEHECDPNLGGIMYPCHVVFAPMEIIKDDCQCIDCGGNKPDHSSNCKYMADLTDGY